MKDLKASVSRLFPRQLVIAAGTLVVGSWLLFFDSHSLVDRARWSIEVSQLEADNQYLRSELHRLDSLIDEGLTPTAIERLARLQYGLRRTNDAVFVIETTLDPSRP